MSGLASSDSWPHLESTWASPTSEVSRSPSGYRRAPCDCPSRRHTHPLHRPRRHQRDGSGPGTAPRAKLHRKWPFCQASAPGCSSSRQRRQPPGLMVIPQGVSNCPAHCLGSPAGHQLAVLGEHLDAVIAAIHNVQIIVLVKRQAGRAVEFSLP